MTLHALSAAADSPELPAQTVASAQAAHCGTEDLLGNRTPFQREGLSGDLTRLTDSAIGPEGALWDSAPAVAFVGSGTVTYDLESPRPISALFLQADSNDTYRVTGSIDGSAGTFTVIAEMPSVLERGHGLRSRTAIFPPVAVRYLRLSAGGGDGSFSIAEFAAFCRAPTPFPPAVRIVGAPPASGRATGSPPNVATEDEDGGSRTILLVIAGVLVALGFAGGGARARGRSRRESPSEPREDGAEAAVAAGSAREQRSRVENALRLMFVASGCAALIYEVVWFHLMRLVIGASALSVGIVLASFMGGMFLGSLLFPRFVSRHQHPLRVYAVLEIGIGIFGLLMPLVLPAIRFVYVGLVGYGALGIALRALVAAILLLPPTALMGATLPAIARRYSRSRRGMSGLAGLYAANTFGAVLGSLLAAFYLLAVWDVWVATLTAAALNIAVGAYATRLARSVPREIEPAAVARVRARSKRPLVRNAVDVRMVYVAVALSGLTALGAQVLWTRLLTLLFGATVFAFAIILAVFLGGLGLGSALAAHLIRRGQNALRGLAWTQMLLVPALLLSGFVLARFLPFASPPAGTPVRALHGLHVIRAINVILPAAVLWGMSFPFALAAASRAGGDTGRSSAYVYAANTIGAILGALAVSFIVVPSLGSAWAQKLLIALAGLSAAVLFRALLRASAAKGDEARRVWLVHPSWALGAGLLAAAFVPGLSKVFLAHGRYLWWVDPRDQYPYVSEGMASTVAVHIAPDGYKNFHVSGRVEATNNPNDLRTERLIGHLSGLPHPRPESVLVVGLGAGVSAGALTLYPEVKRIVVCEIEPRVVGAAELFAVENYSVLSDPRVEMVFDDARHFLATTREKFDVITSDPIHPWVRGNSILFSREYYAIVKAKLKPGGIATQWVPLYETSELAIRIQMRTFMDAFPHGTVWNTASSGKGYDVVLVGSVEPLKLDVAATQRRIRENPRLYASLKEVKIENALDLFATYGASGSDMRAWLEGAPINRDFSLRLEYISGLALNRGEADPIYASMVAGRTYPRLVASKAEHAELRRRLQIFD